jgi:hypothetical protein
MFHPWHRPCLPRAHNAADRDSANACASDGEVRGLNPVNASAPGGFPGQFRRRGPAATWGRMGGEKNVDKGDSAIGSRGGTLSACRNFLGMLARQIAPAPGLLRRTAGKLKPGIRTKTLRQTQRETACRWLDLDEEKGALRTCSPVDQLPGAIKAIAALSMEISRNPNFSGDVPGRVRDTLFQCPAIRSSWRLMVFSFKESKKSLVSRS